MTATDHDHETIAEAGQCTACRAHAIEVCADAPDRYVLVYPDHNAIAVVRDWSGDPLSVAWATGVNPGGDAAALDLPPALSHLPDFELIRGPVADALVDQVRSMIRDGAPCDCGRDHAGAYDVGDLVWADMESSRWPCTVTALITDRPSIDCTCEHDVCPGPWYEVAERNPGPEGHRWVFAEHELSRET